QVLAKDDQVLSFLLEIEFLQNHFQEFLDGRVKHIPFRNIGMPVQKRCQVNEHFEVHGYLITDVGPLDLHGHGSAVKKGGPMNLRERSGGKRRFVEKGK